MEMLSPSKMYCRDHYPYEAWLVKSSVPSPSMVVVEYPEEVKLVIGNPNVVAEVKTTSGEIQIAKVGDYIVRNKFKDVFVMSKKKFKKEFKEVSHEKSDGVIYCI